MDAPSLETAPAAAAGSVQQLLASAWENQYAQPKHSHEQAQRALALAQEQQLAGPAAWARLCIGYYQLRYATPKEAQSTLFEAEKGFASIDDRRGLLLATNGFGRLRMMHGDMSGALVIFLKNRTETDAAITPLDRFYTLNGLTGCYWAQGDWAQSLAHSFEALGLLRGLNAKHQLAVLLTNLGGQLVDVGDFEAALELLTEALGITEGFAHALLQLGLRANLVQCLLALNRAEEALPLARELAGSDQLALVTAAEADILHAAAEAFIANGAWDDARVCLERGYAIGIKFDSTEVKAVNTWLTGLLTYRKGLVNDALPLLKSAARQIEATQLLTTKCKVFQLLATACAEAGDFHAGFQYQQAHFRHYDARLGIASRAHYYALQIRYELSSIREQRDQSEHLRIQSDLAKAELEALNHALHDKIQQIEELQGQLREQALRDPLTGLYNRRYLETVLADLIALNGRSGRKLSLAMLDLDHFKDVNDRHGHPFGDQVLAALAKLLSAGTRASDIVCRYGGEEFCVIFPDTEPAEAEGKLVTLLRSSQATAVGSGETVVDGIGFSAGLACCPQHGTTPEQLLEAADAALYAAKQAGRGRVLIAR